MERNNKKIYLTDISDLDYFDTILGKDMYMVFDKRSIISKLNKPSINDNVINYLTNIESVKKLAKLSRNRKIHNIVFMLSLSSPDKVKQDFINNVISKLDWKPTFEFYIVTSNEDVGKYDKSNFIDVIVRK